MKLLLLLASFVLVMLFLAVLAFLLERYWRAYQAKQADEPNTSNPSIINGVAEYAADWIAKVRGLVQPALPDKQMVTLFRAWIERDLGQEPALQRWLLALSEPGLALLTQHIAAFCTELNFDLTWLLAQQVTVAPELKQTMQAVIVDYCRACQTAVPAQEQARLFALYQKLLRNPAGKAEQALGRTLYANLTAAGLAPMPAVMDLINGTERERQQQAHTAIQQAAAQDWPQFARILHATVTPPSEPTAPAPNGTASNGTASNGTVPNGAVSNGSTPGSVATNGSMANGAMTNGVAPTGKGTPLQSRQDQLRSKQATPQAN